MNTQIGSLPRHQYVWVDSRITHEEPCGFVPAVWFGLVSIPGRAWGCNVMFESGAIYRSVPPHAISFSEDPETDWDIDDAELWDCYGYDWHATEYTYLRGLRCDAIIKCEKHPGTYLFTAVPIGDGFSDAPDQAKEFMFIMLDNDRLTIQPTNRVMFEDRSFTDVSQGVPRLRLQTEIYSCE